MIKKMSLFFDTSVSRLIDTNPKFAGSLGLRKAVRLPNEVLGSAVAADGDYSSQINQSKVISGDAWKYFSMGYPEYIELKDAVYKSRRAEAILSLYREGIIRLEIMFYRSGEKKFFFGLWFQIEVDMNKKLRGGALYIE